MQYFPVFFDIRERPCLVVGGGEVAARKAEQLLRAHAEVRVVAPAMGEAMTGLLQQEKLTGAIRPFAPADLTDCVLVVAATSDEHVNRQVADSARARNIPVNVVDSPELCSFIVPAILERHPLQLAVSTGGAAPMLARHVRARLETLIPSAYGRLAGLIGETRALVKQRFPDVNQRRRFWEDILQGPIAELVFTGRETAARRALEKKLRRAPDQSPETGEVYLVGGGPGDPELLTLRALRLMQQAEVVLYDRLVAPAIVDLVRKDARRLYVGKCSDSHTVPQHELNRMLVELARQGQRVLRLKGGDPFIFGRGGEEIQELAAAGIPFQVAPGITAAAGCASYAGIPLTHRDYAHSCLFVTGHLRDGQLDFNWQALMQPKQTIAIYMGIKSIGTLRSKLLAHGMAADKPAAIIEQGATPEQKVHIGTVGVLPELVAAGNITPPAIIIIGEVVQLHETLAWRE